MDTIDATTNRTDRLAEIRQLDDEQLDALIEGWLPDEFDFRVATKRERGEWFALAVDFDVTGKGPTRAAAVRQMGDLLGIYLAAFLVEGSGFQDAVRPIPVRLRVRIQIESALGWVIHRIIGGFPLSREQNYILPVSEVAAHARC